MKVNKTFMKAISSGFEDLTLVDWFLLAIGILKLLADLFQSDGNGGLEPKDELRKSPESE